MKRKMGTFDVCQRTSDGMFNATELLKQWNAMNGTRKELASYFKMESTNEFIEALKKEENLDMAKSPYVKSRASRGNKVGTWMHPLLFIDFAMWINPTFKVKVLKFVYDEMIKYRNEAGDAYRKLGASVQTIVPKSFMPSAMSKTAEAINWVVFNGHQLNQRNNFGNEEAQRTLYELENKLSDLINEGFIKTFDAMIQYLRQQYARRNYPKVFNQ